MRSGSFFQLPIPASIGQFYLARLGHYHLAVTLASALAEAKVCSSKLIIELYDRRSGASERPAISHEYGFVFGSSSPSAN